MPAQALRDPRPHAYSVGRRMSPVTPVRRRLLAQAFKLFDLIMVVGAYAIVSLGIWTNRHDMSLIKALGLTIRVDSLLVLVALMLAWHWTFDAFGLYHSHRLAGRRREITEVTIAAFLAAMLSLVPAAALHLGDLSWRRAFGIWAAATGATIIARLVIREVLGGIRLRGHNQRYVVVVGTGPRAIRFARQIEAAPELGYQLVGFVDDTWEQMGEFQQTGYRLLGSLSDFARVLRDHVIDEAVIGLPMNSQYRRASEVVTLCEEQGIIVRTLADIFDVKAPHSPRVNSAVHETVVTLFPGAMDRPGAVGKRFLDLILSSILLVLASPVMLLAAAWVRLDSPGPVFFRQQRRGLNKRPFTMLKFRTMRQDAEQMLDSVVHLNQGGGPSFKIERDPRITRAGRYLRKFSIDELPQLINVFKGEMSLVGPRPLFAWEFDRVQEAWVKRRCSVRPGLTGLWQVSGRSDLAFDERIELDLEYIDNWSLWMDVHILARTIPAVVLGRGAV